MADEKTRFQEDLEERRRRQAVLAALKEKRDKATRRFRASLNALLENEAGKDFIISLFHLCGYNQSSTVSDPHTGEVNLVATAHNEARRSVYVDVRKNANPDLLAVVEKMAEAETFAEAKQE